MDTPDGSFHFREIFGSLSLRDAVKKENQTSMIDFLEYLHRDLRMFYYQFNIELAFKCDEYKLKDSEKIKEAEKVYETRKILEEWAENKNVS